MVQKVVIVEKSIDEIEEIIKNTILESKGVVLNSNSRRIDWNKKYGSQIIDCITFILNEENKIKVKTIVQSEPENKIGNTKTLNNFYSNLALKTPVKEIETNKINKKLINSSNRNSKKEEEFKPYLLYILLGICFIMFVIYQSNKNPNIPYESYNEESNINEENVIKTLEDTKQLLNELLSFKDKSDFHYYGFGGAYKYNDWLKKADELRDRPCAKTILVKYGFALGDLQMLGLEYNKSKGKETEYSIWAKKRISEGVNYE